MGFIKHFKDDMPSPIKDGQRFEVDIKCKLCGRTFKYYDDYYDHRNENHQAQLTMF